MKHTRTPAIKLSLIIVPLLLISVVAVSLLRLGAGPFHKTIGLAALYASAKAAQQTDTAGATFWRIERTTNNGPMAKMCTGGGEPNEQRTILIYNDHHTTALLESSDGAPLYQRFSDDADVKASDISDFQGANDSTLWAVLDGAALTDQNGNRLPKSAAVTQKDEGAYDIYARYIGKPGTKDYNPACSTLMIHARIDAPSKTFTKIEVFKDSVAMANLSFAIEQKITSASPPFSQVEPEFKRLGFDRSVADLKNQGQDFVEIDNVEAGYTFSYSKSVFGTAQLKTVQDASTGATTEYRYTFSGSPRSLLIIRAPGANDEYPADVAALRSLAKIKGWKTVDGRDWSTDGMSGWPTLPPAPMAGLEISGGGLRRMVYQNGSPYLPTTYSEIPDGIHMPTSGSYPQGYTLEPLSIVPFKPGSPVPRMH
jgi:hypothetical protein